MNVPLGPLPSGIPKPPLPSSFGPPPLEFSDWDLPGPCRRRLFWLLPPKHRWAVVGETGKYRYEQCAKPGCGVRRIVEKFRGGYQPIIRGWDGVDVVEATGDLDRSPRP